MIKHTDYPPAANPMTAVGGRLDAIQRALDAARDPGMWTCDIRDPGGEWFAGSLHPSRFAAHRFVIGLLTRFGEDEAEVVNAIAEITDKRQSVTTPGGYAVLLRKCPAAR